MPGLKFLVRCIHAVIGRRRFVRLHVATWTAAWLMGLLSAACVFQASAADVYPHRPVRLIIPYPPGGAGDFVGRLLGAKLTESLGQQVVNDNRPGGGQLIATQLAAQAQPDGYTLFLASATHGINPGLRKKLPYDSIKDFAPVTLVASSPLIFVAHPSLNVGTIQELVALAKARPGKINYGSSGPGTGGHLSVEMLKWMTHIDMVHVPYKGAGPALTALVAGQVQLVCTSPLAALPFVRDGRLRGLAMTSRTRSQAAPDIPTVAESGVPGYAVVGWYGWVYPAGTPQAIVDTLNRELEAIMKTPEMVKTFETQGAEQDLLGPATFVKFMEAESAKWGKVIKQGHIKLE